MDNSYGSYIMRNRLLFVLSFISLTLIGCGGGGSSETGNNTTQNSTPVASAGLDQSVSVGAPVTLNGNGSSDADTSDTLSYSWTFSSLPVGSSAVLSDATTISPSFTPDVAGSYDIALVVYDGTINSTPDTLTVTASNSVTSLLPDTGQSKCYNGLSEITCPTQGSAFYGQDAHYSTNPMSFTDNGNGTVTDNVTGLIWQQEYDGTTRNWADAITYCTDLDLGGSQNWRLPSIGELITLVDYGKGLPNVTIDTVKFPNTYPGDYWSATILSGSTLYVWVVSFESGGSTGTSHSENWSLFPIRCVR